MCVYSACMFSVIIGRYAVQFFFLTNTYILPAAACVRRRRDAARRRRRRRRLNDFVRPPSTPMRTCLQTHITSSRYLYIYIWYYYNRVSTVFFLSYTCIARFKLLIYNSRIIATAFIGLRHLSSGRSVGLALGPARRRRREINNNTHRDVYNNTFKTHVTSSSSSIYWPRPDLYVFQNKSFRAFTSRSPRRASSSLLL